MLDPRELPTGVAFHLVILAGDCGVRVTLAQSLSGRRFEVLPTVEVRRKIFGLEEPPLARACRSGKRACRRRSATLVTEASRAADDGDGIARRGWCSSGEKVVRLF